MRFPISVLAAVVMVSGSVPAVAQTQRPAQPPAAPTPAAAGSDLFEIGRQLFEQYASPEIKAQYEFPSKERWDEFATRFQRSLEGDSLQELAVYLPEARVALSAVRTLPDYAEYADWLEQRIDEIEGAKEVTAPTPTTNPTTPTPPGPRRPSSSPTPGSKLSPQNSSALPHYDLWVARVRGRPLPSRAAELMPRLRAAFTAEGVPPELAWLAEAESSFNPDARSPVGAKGLFQFM
ncbi:MAG: transglycosylase SLT domain-containing protein, partial [Opitutaceae bacterium]